MGAPIESALGLSSPQKSKIFGDPRSEARFFHPGMAYHQACGEGRLFLMAPHPDNYLNPDLMARTEAAIKAKDERKGYAYRPLPHSSTRWRMIAGNVMLALCAGQVQ